MKGDPTQRGDHNFGYFLHLTLDDAMKKLYVFLATVITVLSLGTGAFAQTFAASDYKMRVHGDTYVPLSNPSVIWSAPNYSQYNYVSGQVTMPFNIRLFNVISNKFRVTATGDMIFARDANFSNWPEG